MTERMRLQVGPPHSTISEGMNTSYRRQQLTPNYYRMLRNIKVAKEALQKSGGRHRIAEGDLPAESAKCGATAGTDFVTVPYTDTTAIADYQFGPKFTVFQSFRADSLASNNLIIGQGQDPTGNPPFWIWQATNGKITAAVTDAGGATITVTTTIAYTKIGEERQVQLVRDKAGISLYVDDDDPVTNTGLDPAFDTKATTDDIYIAGHPTDADGSAITLYETRLLRRADTNRDWRITQYPWTGRFGDPDVVLHLLYEEGTGAALTDYSRIKNETITLDGSWTWLASTLRQTVAPVTGIHITGSVRGRRRMLIEAGKNHYRVALN